jgi:hypothetical protein
VWRFSVISAGSLAHSGSRVPCLHPPRSASGTRVSSRFPSLTASAKGLGRWCSPADPPLAWTPTELRLTLGLQPQRSNGGVRICLCERLPLCGSVGPTTPANPPCSLLAQTLLLAVPVCGRCSPDAPPSRSPSANATSSGLARHWP